MLIQDEAKQFASEEGKKLPCLQYHPHRVKVCFKRFLIKTRMLDIENEHNLLKEKSMYIFREALKKIILFL